MKKNMFECRADVRSRFGVMEKFKVFFKDNVATVTILCGVDNVGCPTIPAYLDASTGFTPLPLLKKEKESEEDMLVRFVKSNKPYFAVVGEFVFLADLVLKFDMKTGEMLDSSKIKFFTPNHMEPTGNYFSRGEYPALQCDEVSTEDILQGYKVPEKLYGAYLDSVKSTFTLESCLDRVAYLTKRLER